MSDQMLLPGIDPRPELTDRIFFAVLPDSTILESIENCRQGITREYGLRGRPIITGRLHVSLLGLGDYAGIPQKLIEVLYAAAAKVDVITFRFSFDRLVSFSGGRRGRPLVLAGDEDAEGLVLLQRQLIGALRACGLRVKAGTHFTPHLTVLYASRKIPERAVQPISWDVREFVLVRSLIGMNLPYEVLGRWPLLQ